MPRTALNTVKTNQYQGGAPFPGEDLVDDRRAEQEDLHEVLVLAQESLPARFLLLACQFVPTIFLQPLLCLGRAQPLCRVDLKLLGNRLRQSACTISFDFQLFLS